MVISRSNVDDISRPSTNLKSYFLPLFGSAIAAGFPSPADDFLESKIDLNQHLIANPLTTFFLRVSGDSMIGAGIHSGDLLIVDRSFEPSDGRIVIAVVNGELLVKRLRLDNGQVYLVAENPDYPALKITEAMNFQIWGVVTNVIHAV